MSIGHSFRAFLFATGPALLSLSCANAVTSPEVYSSARTIEAGCSGGVIGFVEAVSVHRDGQVDYTVLSESVRAGPEFVSKAAAEKWFATLEEARFLDRESEEIAPMPDGIGCGISLKGPQFTHSLDLHAELNPKIRRVFDEIVGLLQRE